MIEIVGDAIITIIDFFRTNWGCFWGIIVALVTAALVVIGGIILYLFKIRHKELPGLDLNFYYGVPYSIQKNPDKKKQAEKIIQEIKDVFGEKTNILELKTDDGKNKINSKGYQIYYQLSPKGKPRLMSRRTDNGVMDLNGAADREGIITLWIPEVLGTGEDFYPENIKNGFYVKWIFHYYENKKKAWNCICQEYKWNNKKWNAQSTPREFHYKRTNDPSMKKHCKKCPFYKLTPVDGNKKDAAEPMPDLWEEKKKQSSIPRGNRIRQKKVFKQKPVRIKGSALYGKIDTDVQYGSVSAEAPPPLPNRENLA